MKNIRKTFIRKLMPYVYKVGYFDGYKKAMADMEHGITKIKLEEAQKAQKLKDWYENKPII